MQETKPRVIITELGVYLRAIELEYKPKNNEHRAQLITDNFPVLCLEEDIEEYEEMCYYSSLAESQDYDLIGKRDNYCRELGRSNPFY